LVAGVGTDIMNSPREPWDELNYAPAVRSRHAGTIDLASLRQGLPCNSSQFTGSRITGGQHRGVDRIMLHAPDPITPRRAERALTSPLRATQHGRPPTHVARTPLPIAGAQCHAVVTATHCLPTPRDGFDNSSGDYHLISIGGIIHNCNSLISRRHNVMQPIDLAAFPVA